MTDEMLEPRSLSGGKQSGSEDMNDEVEIQHRPCPDGHSMWAEGLAEEILVKIFSMVVDEEGAVPFLCRAARVCQSWCDATSDSQLWREVDLDQCRIKRCARTLRWLVDNRLSRVTNLNLSWWVGRKSENYMLMYLFDSCRHLQTLNLSYCNLTWRAIKVLCTLPNLQNLNLTRALDAFEYSSAMLCFMLRSLGPRLRELNLSNNDIKGLRSIKDDKFMDAVMDNCPNLTLFDVSSCALSTWQRTLNIERFQRSCPKLRVLRLNDTCFSPVKADEEAMLASSGFPDLEELNASAMSKYAGGVNFDYNDDFIIRMLRNSPNLRDLDIRDCHYVFYTTLLMIPAQHLKNLRISYCYKIGSNEGIVKIINKWKDSLENVDISWINFPPSTLDQALKLMGQHGTPLRSLNLTGTKVSREALRTLLMGCRQLTTLDLTFTLSTYMPRSAERRYEGREALDKLFNTLS